MGTASPLPLSRAFYARPATVVARDCLGKLLVHDAGGEILAGRIVEAEAYVGPADKAAHCYNGRRSRRNEVMFGPPGFAYVFFIYGMHYHLNLVTDVDGYPSAVLIRAVEPVLGEERMRERRGNPSDRRLISNGPGKLCVAFSIGREDNGVDLCGSRLYLADGPAPRRVVRCPRIGVEYAGHWSKRLLRFIDADSSFVSKPARRQARPPLSR